ncbi:MAG TPA: fatty acid desaturase [Tepidisphaeraceae bacterium]|nr:fatty acid desaturase [Tepidisphaeraceae bacterium]
MGIIAAQLLAFVGCLIAASRASTAWQIAALSLVFGVIMNSVYSIIHEAEHAMLFSNSRLNEAAGVVMALLFPAPFHLLRQGHIGHHMRNRSDDEAFDLYFEGDSVIWKWLVWIGILTGLYYLLVVTSNVLAVVAPFVFDRKHFKVERHVVVDRASVAFLESFNPRYLRWIWLEGFLAILVHIGIVWGLGFPVMRYIILYATFGFMWSAMQYVHHYATERHVTRGARNLFLFRPIDAIWLNHNWHRTHHEHPTMPWIYLPAIARDNQQTHRGFLPLAYLRMWHGPRKTGEHVQNKYAGRIIQ